MTCKWDHRLVGQLALLIKLQILYPREIGMCLCVTVTAMSILPLRKGNYQVLVILRSEMDFVDFCFLPNKCYHVIPSSCSKLLMNFQTEIS